MNAIKIIDPDNLLESLEIENNQVRYNILVEQHTKMLKTKEITG